MQPPFAVVSERLKGLLEVGGTDADFARAIGVSPKKLGIWKLRGIIPLEKVVEICDEKRFSLDYVLLGRAPADAAATSPAQIERQARDLSAIADYALRLQEANERIAELHRELQALRRDNDRLKAIGTGGSGKST